MCERCDAKKRQVAASLHSDYNTTVSVCTDVRGRVSEQVLGGDYGAVLVLAATPSINGAMGASMLQSGSDAGMLTLIAIAINRIAEAADVSIEDTLDDLVTRVAATAHGHTKLTDLIGSSSCEVQGLGEIVQDTTMMSALGNMMRRIGPGGPKEA